MKQDVKDILFSIAFVLITVTIVLSTLFGIEKYQNRDKFQVGDIVKVVYDHEFSTNTYYYKIKKVGKRYYLTKQFHFPSDDYMIVIKEDSEELKFWLNDNATKVE